MAFNLSIFVNKCWIISLIPLSDFIPSYQKYFSAVAIQKTGKYNEYSMPILNKTWTSREMFKFLPNVLKSNNNITHIQVRQSKLWEICFYWIVVFAQELYNMMVV